MFLDDGLYSLKDINVYIGEQKINIPAQLLRKHRKVESDAILQENHHLENDHKNQRTNSRRQVDGRILSAPMINIVAADVANNKTDDKKKASLNKINDAFRDLTDNSDEDGYTESSDHDVDSYTIPIEIRFPSKIRPNFQSEKERNELRSKRSSVLHRAEILLDSRKRLLEQYEPGSGNEADDEVRLSPHTVSTTIGGSKRQARGGIVPIRHLNVRNLDTDDEDDVKFINVKVGNCYNSSLYFISAK